MIPVSMDPRGRPWAMLLAAEGRVAELAMDPKHRPLFSTLAIDAGATQKPQKQKGHGNLGAGLEQ